MKELDKSKIYDLRYLNQEERIKLAIKTKNPYVEKINDFTRFLTFCKPINHWQVGEKTNNQPTNAKELFEPEYEVKYIAEGAKEDKPKHYSNGIDTFARMESNCTLEECLAFAKGNIDKYNWRTKNQDLEDYTKIIAYANWAIKLLNKKENENNNN